MRVTPFERNLSTTASALSLKREGKRASLLHNNLNYTPSPRLKP
jgi:hypothetical protein